MTIKNMPFLAPAAFTIVMGTGAFAVASLEMSTLFTPIIWVARFINILNFLLFAILAAWAAVSWPRNLPIMRENFEHPDNCALYSASGIAVLVLSAQALRFDFGYVAAISIWLAGALLTLVFNYGILLRFFLHSGEEMAHITPVLFVPVASMVVLPVAGAPICAVLPEIAKNLIVLVCILALGGGLALYMGLFSIMLQRHLLIRPLPDQLAPTLWIHLAPIGWAGVALLTFSAYVFPPEYKSACQLIAFLLFGAALWWLIMSALVCIRAIRHHNLSFNLTWWSFIFPMGSITILSGRLNFAAANMLFPFLWCLMGSLWLYCAIKTIIFLRRH